MVQRRKVMSEKQMSAVRQFMKRKNIVFSARRYGIDALGAMAQGLFASLLIGTIISTLGEQAGIPFLVTAGGYAKAVSGPAMAISIGYALQAPQLVLFSLLAVGEAANELGGAGGPLAVLVVTIFAAEFGKAVSKETKIDILVTPLVTILIGTALSAWWAPGIGSAANAVGQLIMWATELQPFFMGIFVSVIVGIALTLPISSAAICAALNLTGLAGGAAVAGCCAQMVGFAVMSFRENRWGGLVAQGLGTTDLDPAHTGIRHHRPHRHLHLRHADEWPGSLVRHGYLRAGRSDRRLHGMARRHCIRRQSCHHTHGLDRPSPDLLHPACRAEYIFL